MESKKGRNRPASPIPSGEIRGSMLIGLVEAFKNIHAISGDEAADMVEGLDSAGWYPMSSFFDVLDEVRCDDIDDGPLLFRAGMAVAEDWYLNGDGRRRVAGASDFLRLQANSGGYESVHRGQREDIGWLDLVELDEAAGHAKIVCVTPYPTEFERGIIHGGTLMCGDVQFVQVDSEEEPYSDHLSKKTLTVSFRRKPDERIDAALDAELDRLSPERPVELSAPLQEALVWRLKGVEAQLAIERSFHRQSNLLLARAARDIRELTQKLDELAHHDELTGLWNRRAILRRAETLLALGARHRWPTAFIVIDIDHFKPINDTWGHALGDEALKLIAAVLRDRLRDSDLLGRIGGEEFLVILPNAGVEGARVAAESLRAEVEKQALLSPVGGRIPLTASFGVVVAAGDPTHDIGEYIRQADQAMYQAKREGRNRVVCFTG
ncbi:MAG TPA: GGDEF domain-containing protein [Rhodocyclaceae bacterium]